MLALSHKRFAAMAAALLSFERRIVLPSFGFSRLLGLFREAKRVPCEAAWRREDKRGRDKNPWFRTPC